MTRIVDEPGPSGAIQDNYIRQCQSIGSRRNVLVRTWKLAIYIYLKILAPYLDSPSVEAISESSQIKDPNKKQHISK